MAYGLGIDLGTTWTAAAVVRDGRGEVVPLGDRAAAVPSVLLTRDDGTVLVGDAAVRRGMSESDRVAREFKRRVGDTTPLILGGTPWSAEALMGRLLRWVVDQVTAREGGPPDAVVVTHPANWGGYKTELLAQALRQADLPAGRLLTEPEAAARYYAVQERVEPGAVVAVYDLGGGTFDATVLRTTASGFEVLGRPDGIERMGGIDIDAAVYAHVVRAVGPAFTELDVDDPQVLGAVARLRQDCVDAKEALSHDTDATIPVLLPGISTEVRITRNELETMVRPVLADTVATLRRAIAGAGVSTDEVSRVLLVGGSSRMPLVPQLVTAELGRPVAIDAHPKFAVALGAAMAADPLATAGGPPTVIVPVPAEIEVPPPAAPGPVVPAAPPPFAPRSNQPVPPPPPRPTPFPPAAPPPAALHPTVAPPPPPPPMTPVVVVPSAPPPAPPPPAYVSPPSHAGRRPPGGRRRVVVAVVVVAVLLLAASAAAFVLSGRAGSLLP